MRFIVLNVWNLSATVFSSSIMPRMEISINPHSKSGCDLQLEKLVSHMKTSDGLALKSKISSPNSDEYDMNEGVSELVSLVKEFLSAHPVADLSTMMDCIELSSVCSNPILKSYFTTLPFLGDVITNPDKSSVSKISIASTLVHLCPNLATDNSVAAIWYSAVDVLTRKYKGVFISSDTFAGSFDILAGPAAPLYAQPITITGGLAVQNWFTSVSASMNPSGDEQMTAVGRFIALAVLYNVKLDRVPVFHDAKVDAGFRDIIPIGDLADAYRMLKTIPLPEIPVSPDKPESDMKTGLREMEDGNMVNLKLIIPLVLGDTGPADSRWDRLGGAELVRLAYAMDDVNDATSHSMLRSVLFLAARTEGHYPVYVAELCRHRQSDLQEAIRASIKNWQLDVEESMPPSDEEAKHEVMYDLAFAADWIDVCPSVFDGDVRVPLSHVLLRSIASTDQWDNFIGLRDKLFIDIILQKEFDTAKKVDQINFGDFLEKTEYENVFSKLQIGFGPIVSPRLVQDHPCQPYVKYHGVSKFYTSMLPMLTKRVDMEQVYEALIQFIGLVILAAQECGVDASELKEYSGLESIHQRNPGDFARAFARPLSWDKFSLGAVVLAMTGISHLYPEVQVDPRNLLLAKTAVSHNMFPVFRVIVHRASVLADSRKYLDSWKLVSAKFIGEDGVGPGALADWLSVLSSELATATLVSNTASPPYSVLIEESTYLRALGQVIGLSLLIREPLALKLPIMFYAALIGSELELDDIAKDEPTLFKSFKTMLDGPFESYMEDFELANGSNVFDKDTLRQYVNEQVSARIFHGPGMNAVRDGFLAIIPKEAILITAKQLQAVVEGEPDINIEDMKKHVELDKFQSIDNPQIKWLFAFLTEADLKTKQAFLKFVTGTHVVPLGGFVNMSPRLKFTRVPDINKRLPTSHTCFNNLELPMYPSETMLREKLTIAIHADAGMGIP